MKKLLPPSPARIAAPLAFAQTVRRVKSKGQLRTEGVTVTGTIIKMTTEEGVGRQLSARQNSRRSRGPLKSGQLCSQWAGSRCEQEGRSHPNRDQTRRSRACLLRKHRRFAYG